MEILIDKLKKIEKQNYRAYQQIKGEYDFTDFMLFIDHIQPDPYASASRFRARRAWSLTELTWLKEESLDYQRAARDFIARSFAHFAKQDNDVDIAFNGQSVLDSTAVIFDDEGIELRFRINLPAEGRQILGKRAINLITFHLPKMIRKATLARELDLDALKQHCQVIEDQVALRSQLAEHDLLAFVANGSILPRASGTSDLPMKDAQAFQAPESLAITLNTPHSGPITGMGVRRGINLIVGGGFHGKSTLLTAIERGIYDHIPNDGREYVVTDPQAVKIRAEDGRCVHHLNLSNFINNLPMGKSTTDFSTLDASGSTSQAAWLQEALESGANSLLIDEDTSATNFMIRDQRMQALVSQTDEPITPLIDRIEELYQDFGVSSVIVMGGSGDYLDVATCVIQMHDYQPLDVTDKAKQVSQDLPSVRKSEQIEKYQNFKPRSFQATCLQQILAEGKFRIQGKGTQTLRFGKEHVDVSALEQLESSNELNAIGWLWFLLSQQAGLDPKAAWMKQPAKAIDALLDDNWHSLMPKNGDLAKPRTLDVMAALNRLREAKFKV